MDKHKRSTLKWTAGLVATIGASGLASRAAMAQDMKTSTLAGDSYSTDAGKIVIHPVEHASLVMQAAGKTIYVDPVGGASLYEGLPAPDLILVTHEHRDHFDVPTLESLVSDSTGLVTNPAVFSKFPAGLAAKARAIANGQSTPWEGMEISAVPAYNTTPDRQRYHPQGRDNGYILPVEGKRIYIAGDTEDIPEMASIGPIEVAFLPMNLPFTMTVEQAANAVGMFKPAFVYPYHYRGSDIDLFERMVSAGGSGAKVVRHNWYPGA